MEREQDYWVYVAIDRFTEQVIDKQSEMVTEYGSAFRADYQTTGQPDY